MRYLIGATLAYFLVGSIGLVAEDWRYFGELLPEGTLAVVMAAACFVGMISVLTGWGL